MVHPWHHLLSSIVLCFSSPPKRRHPRERFLLPKEWHALRHVLDAQPDKVRIYFYLLLLEGPRMSEAREMQVCHLDLEAKLWYKPKTKNGHSQVLPLSPQSCQFLAQLPAIGRYVFPGATPNVPWSRTAVEYWWRKIRRQADLLDVQIRDLRRTCASWMTMHGENLKVIQTLLDHRSLQTTQIYARLDQGTMRVALSKHAERLLSPLAS